MTLKTLEARRRPLSRLRGLMATLWLGTLLACPSGCAESYGRTMPTATESAPVVSVAPAPPPPAVVTSGSAGEAPAATALPPARERPGLGTEWGETRDSPLRDVAFARSSETHPFAMAEVRYNDEPGIEALAGYAGQHGARTREAPAVSHSITLSVRDEDGSPLSAVQVGRQWFVVGQEGMRYTIVLQNHTGHRVEAVTTVDGLDVMNGSPGSVHNRGYLLMPYDSLEIDGFRQSHETVAAFRFGRVGDSYAAKTGTARNVGVIGVAFFDEAGDPWGSTAEDETRRRAVAEPFPADHRADRRYAEPPL